jgi:hypothetical protein
MVFEDRSHLDPDELLGYYGKRLQPEQEALLEKHLALCNECATNASTVYLLEPLRHALTETAATGLYDGASLLETLAAAVTAATQADWRQRLEQGLTKLLDHLGEAVKTAPRIKVGAGGGQWVFGRRPGAAARTRGEARRLPRYDVLESGAPPPPAASGREVAVLLTLKPPSDDRPAFVVLVPLTPAGRVAVERLQPVTAEPGVWEARFGAVEAGEYLLVFEPSG